MAAVAKPFAAIHEWPENVAMLLEELARKTADLDPQTEVNIMSAARIVGFAEWKAQRGVAPGEALVLELLRAVDQKIEDVERTVACWEAGMRCELRLVELRRRSEQLEGLRRRADVLAS